VMIFQGKSQKFMPKNDAERPFARRDRFSGLHSWCSKFNSQSPDVEFFLEKMLSIMKQCHIHAIPSVIFL
jgi:hypothetical protein